MVRTLPLHSENRPEMSRVLALAAAIAIHVFAFMLLLIPMAAPRMDTSVEAPRIPPWVQPIDVLPPPQPPEIVPIRPQTARPQVERVVPRITTPAVDQVIVENGNVAADPVVETSSTIDDTGPAISTPLAGVQLEYAFAPAPPYPRDAARAGLEGRVVLKILVGTDGNPLDVQIHKGSGHRTLDDTAKRFVLKNWRFQPAMRNGQAVQAYGLVPIEFSMQ